MIVSPDALRKELVALIKTIDTELEEVKPQVREEADLVKWTYANLLSAKATAYSSLIELQRK